MVDKFFDKKSKGGGFKSALKNEIKKNNQEKYIHPLKIIFEVLI